MLERWKAFNSGKFVELFTRILQVLRKFRANFKWKIYFMIIFLNSLINSNFISKVHQQSNPHSRFELPFQSRFSRTSTWFHFQSDSNHHVYRVSKKSKRKVSSVYSLLNLVGDSPFILSDLIGVVLGGERVVVEAERFLLIISCGRCGSRRSCGLVDDRYVWMIAVQGHECRDAGWFSPYSDVLGRCCHG